MKINFVLIIIYFLIQNLFSQEKEWNYYDLDSIVSLEMPFVVYEQDTVIDYGKTYQIFSNGNSSSFIAKKVFLKEGYPKTDNLILPKNKKELKNFYIDLAEVIEEISPYILDHRTVTSLDNLIGYQLIFKNKDGTDVQEINMFLLNKTLYYFNYLDENGLNELDNIRFSNSIYFNENEELLQFTKTRTSALKKILFSLFIVLIISFVLRVNSKRRKAL